MRGFSEVTCLLGVSEGPTPESLTLGRRDLSIVAQEAVTDTGTSSLCWASQRAAARHRISSFYLRGSLI